MHVTYKTFYLPAAYLIFFWVLNYALGFISLQHPKESLYARDAGAAIILPLLTALLWIGNKYSILYAVTAFSGIASHRRHRTHKNLVKIFTTIISTNINKTRRWVFILAALFVGNYLYWSGVINLSAEQTAMSPFRFVLFLQAFVMWVCLISYIVTMVVTFRLSKAYTMKYLRVSLFEIEEMSPLCNLVIVHFLFSVGAISTNAVNGLFVDINIFDKFLVFLSCLVLAFFLMSPIYLVKKAIKLRKEYMLARINESLNEQMLGENNKKSRRRLVDDDTRLQFISDLLIVRKEIEKAPLWPMNLPFMLKMFFILSLPVFSWLGAGLVSQALKLL